MPPVLRATLLAAIPLLSTLLVVAARAEETPSSPAPSASASDPLKGWGIEDQPAGTATPMPTPVPTPTPMSRQGLGVVAGSTSGIGLAWRAVTESGWGGQIGGGAWVPSFDPPTGSWSVGAQAIRVLTQDGPWRLYGLAGVQSYGYPGAVNADTQSRSYESVLNMGAGLGLEFGFSQGMSLCLEVPLVLGYRLGNNPGFSHLIPIPNALILVNF
jgi:hypothetical protein